MVVAYEQKYGPVENRSELDGDIVVPSHLRNVSLINSRPIRAIHTGLFGSLSRSRTFLTLSKNTSHTYHGSVPDLSRNSCNINKNNNNFNQNKTSSNNAKSVLLLKSKANSASFGSVRMTDEGDDDAGGGRGGAADCNNYSTHSLSRVQHLNKSLDIEVECRRKSEDQTYFHMSQQRQNIKIQSRPVTYQTKPSDFRNENSISANNNRNHMNINYNVQCGSYMTLIRTNIPNAKVNNSVNRDSSFDSCNRNPSPLCGASSLHDIHMIHSRSFTSTPSSAAPSGGTQSPPPLPPPSPLSSSTSFQSDADNCGLNLNVVTKFTIPRVSLSHNSRSASASPINDQK